LFLDLESRGAGGFFRFIAIRFLVPSPPPFLQVRGGRAHGKPLFFSPQAGPARYEDINLSLRFSSGILVLNFRRGWGPDAVDPFPFLPGPTSKTGFFVSFSFPC